MSEFSDRIEAADPEGFDPSIEPVEAGLINRVSAAGFQVSLDLASDVPDPVRSKYGLRNDENIFHCIKAAAP